MLAFTKLVAAVVLNIASGRWQATPAYDYLDTVIMDMECDVEPDCDITIPVKHPGRVYTY